MAGLFGIFGLLTIIPLGGLLLIAAGISGIGVWWGRAWPEALGLIVGVGALALIASINNLGPAPERLAGVESRIRELFGEGPKGRGPHPQHSLVGQEYGSFTRIVGDLARGTLGEHVPVEAIYSTHSLLMHPSVSAVLAFSEKDGPLLKIPRWTPSWLVGSTLTVLVVWRGGLRRVLVHHGWTHPHLPEWSVALDEAVEEHNQRVRSADTPS